MCPPIVYVDTCPDGSHSTLTLYRQSEILHREAGVGIGRATLDGWVLRVGELLLPVAEAMAPRAWASSAWVRPRCLRRAARRRPNGVAGSPAALALHW